MTGNAQKDHRVPLEGLVRLGKIKIGAIVSQDHGIGRWPATRSGDNVNPEMIFEVEWRGSFWDCRADGYGFHAPRGQYGNGSIFVHDKDGVIFDDA